MSVMSLFQKLVAGVLKTWTSKLPPFFCFYFKYCISFYVVVIYYGHHIMMTMTYSRAANEHFIKHIRGIIMENFLLLTTWQLQSNPCRVDWHIESVCQTASAWQWRECRDICTETEYVKVNYSAAAIISLSIFLDFHYKNVINKILHSYGKWNRENVTSAWHFLKRNELFFS